MKKVLALTLVLQSAAFAAAPQRLPSHARSSFGAIAPRALPPVVAAKTQLPPALTRAFAVPAPAPAAKPQRASLDRIAAAPEKAMSAFDGAKGFGGIRSAAAVAVAAVAIACAGCSHNPPDAYTETYIQNIYKTEDSPKEVNASIYGVFETRLRNKGMSSVHMEYFVGRLVGGAGSERAEYEKKMRKFWMAWTSSPAPSPWDY